MKTWLWAAIVWLGLAASAPATPTVRALFVGVNHYAWTEFHPADPLFKDLHGSLNDVALVKSAFATAYGLPIDTLPTTGCEPPGGVSVTLVQDCATGEAIMTAFRAALNASAPGDIVLFYFAGHGAQSPDKAGVKPTGSNSTIMQSDARKDMNDARYADILGVELAVLINKASRAGVNVVTLFDSCNSGTASRALKSDAQVRMAPPAPPGAVLRPVADPGAPGTGYIVHFGAADDGHAASEKPMEDGQVHGVFSWVLSRILLKNSRAGVRNVDYQDISDEIQREVVSLGYPQQQPRSEGALKQTFLGRAPVSTATARVTAGSGGGLTLASGSLSGVTLGSSYGLFVDNTAAAGGAAPTARATVTQVGPYSAQLTASSAPPPGVAWARELEHRIEAGSLRVGLQAAEPLRSKIATVLNGLDVVRLVDRDPQFVILADNNGVHFVGADGSVAGEAGDPASADFADKITLAVKAVAGYEAVLALRDGSTGVPPTITVLPHDDDSESNNPTPHARLVLGDHPKISLTNTSSERRYLYLFGLDPSFAVVPLYPPPGRNDAFEPNTSILSQVDVAADTLGSSQLLLLSTTTPIAIDSFRNPGVPRSMPSPPGALEALLMTAKTGKRTLAAPPVATWSASMATVEVAPPPATP